MVIRIFHGHNPSHSIVVLGSTQPPTKMISKNISLGIIGGRCLGLTTFPHSIADFSKSWGLKIVHPSGSVVGLYSEYSNSYSAVLECYLISAKYFILSSNYICIHLYSNMRLTSFRVPISPVNVKRYVDKRQNAIQ